MSERRCPNAECREELARPAREGGTIYRTRYVRQTAAGATVIACPKCATEIALGAAAPRPDPPHGRLVFPRPTPPA